MRALPLNDINFYGGGKEMFVIIFIFLFFISPLNAQEVNNFSIPEEIIVKSTRSETNIYQLGSSLDIITSEQIKKSGFNFVNEVLQTIPGLYISQNGALGGTATARIRGAASGQTLVLIDGISVNEYTIKNLREKISIVNQDIMLFNDTILNNLTYGKLKNKSQAEVDLAIKLARIDQFSDEFPEGLHTYVGDRGAMLSGGQKQRIAIGRAILKNAPLLILDEPTSSLDTKSEYQIQESLKELMKNKTTLVVAHRLSTIEGADQIIVLDNGKIVEKGTHDELIINASHYANLHRLQFNKKNK